MLDWLNAHEVVSGEGESQMQDPPDTPAPIFAYRALKGILFGSPDYDSEEEDKENIAPAISTDASIKPAPIHSRRANVDPSPLQPKITQSPNSRTRERYPVSPSPRKRRQTSPTKSILRTPGISTPRRQNVNVTFKDVRPSISPIAVTTKLLAAQNEVKAAIQSEEAAKVIGTTNTNARLRTAQAVNEVEVLPTLFYDMGAVDAYLKSTEREMKRLVRYSQRMKEYARASQQENVALRNERGELRRELGEMRKTTIETRRVSDKPATKESLDVRTMGAQYGDDKARRKGLRGAISDPKRPDKTHTVEAAELPDRGASGGDSTVHEPTTQSAKVQLDQKEARDIPTQDGVQAGDLVSKKRAATTAQLPPDRLAAAKERLRVKSEERRRALSAAVG